MGNPFVDSGVSAISQWLNTDPASITKNDLINATEKVAIIFNNQGFKKNLFSIFPNNIITNSSIKGNKQEKLIKCFRDYINSIEELQSNGDCLGCGRRNSKHKLTKTNVPMTGSGKLTNFFSNFDSGVGYCSACTLAIQFSPLSFVASGGRLLMVSSNSWNAINLWTKICIDVIRERALRNEDFGCYNPGYTNPRNCLFYMTTKMVEYEERNVLEDTSIQVFYFTNYNQGPELEIFYLPAPVFNFLRYANQSQYKFMWNNIVKNGYQVNWDKVESEQDYKNKKNLVYEYLLQEKSIIGFFINQKQREAKSDWNLLALYLKEIMNMEEKRIETIKNVADKIAECLRNSGRDKRLGQLERAKNYREFQNVLLFIIKDRIKQDEKEPLFTLDDYLESLFPPKVDGFTNWNETRFLLLFRVYEQLHEWLKDRDLIEDEDEDINQIMEET